MLKVERLLFLCLRNTANQVGWDFRKPEHSLASY